MPTPATVTDVENVTREPMDRLTPPQVDAMFAIVDEAFAKLEAKRERAWTSLHRALGDKLRGHGRTQTWGLPRDEAEAKARTAATADPAGTTAKALAHLDAADTAMRELNQGVRKRLDDEFTRRGGWTRAFLVQGPGGHVHSSEDCSTCNRMGQRTRFVRMVDYSGKSESEIIEDARSRACTVCYRNAPVEALRQPTRMFGPDEIAAQAARAEREAKKKAKQAKDAANAITDVNGGPLYDVPEGMGYRSVIKTLRAARFEITDRCWRAAHWGDKDGRHARAIAFLAPSIATKEGKTTEQVITEAEQRAKRRR
ncbi:hypothetical protein WKI65_44155 [Streptomyces sp. MS1.AVA.3]|uniref:hypothetical protein n=1 Tax=Streptomyces decoyicus TaxID=249567 RepID=UPI0030BFA769